MAELELTARYTEYGDEIWFGGEGCGMWIIESDPHNDLTAYLGGLGETPEGRDAMEKRARLLAAAPKLYDVLEDGSMNVVGEIVQNYADQLEREGLGKVLDLLHEWDKKALAALAEARGGNQ